MTCENSCEAKAYQSEIKRLHKALIAAADALDDAADDIAWFGPSSQEKGWEGDSRLAQESSTKARSVAMSGVKP